MRYTMGAFFQRVVHVQHAMECPFFHYDMTYTVKYTTRYGVCHGVQPWDHLSSGTCHRICP